MEKNQLGEREDQIVRYSPGQRYGNCPGSAGQDRWVKPLTNRRTHKDLSWRDFNGKAADPWVTAPAIDTLLVFIEVPEAEQDFQYQ